MKRNSLIMSAACVSLVLTAAPLKSQAGFEEFLNNLFSSGEAFDMAEKIAKKGFQLIERETGDDFSDVRSATSNAFRIIRDVSGQKKSALSVLKDGLEDTIHGVSSIVKKVLKK